MIAFEPSNTGSVTLTLRAAPFDAFTGGRFAWVHWAAAVALVLLTCGRMQEDAARHRVNRILDIGRGCGTSLAVATTIYAAGRVGMIEAHP